jgi:hypothetical protein
VVTAVLLAILLPALPVETLAGESLVVPKDTGAAVLVVGFTKASREQTKEWADRLDNRLPTYRVLVIENIPRFFRGMVVNEIRKGVPNAIQPRFLIVSDGEKTWKEIAGYRDADDAYILLVNAKGELVWRTAGAFTEAALQQLLRSAQEP